MKIDRLVSIITVLLDKKRIVAKALAEMFEVSPRTIYRDIDAIDRAGIPICATAGVGGGFEIMLNYKIDKNVFSTADLSAILMGLYSIGGVVRGDELINTLTKVRSFIPADKEKDVTLKADRISIDLSPWLGNKNTEKYLTIIKTALQGNRLLSFVYADRHGNKTERIVEPYQLLLKSNHWYFYGYCRIRNDFRLFRLCRILQLDMQEETFIPRAYPKPQTDFHAEFEAMQTEIKLRVHRSVIERLLDYCTYDDIRQENDEYYIVRFPFIENEYYYDILLSFGNRCECLEPLHIRAELKRKVKDILSLYEN